MKLRFMQELGLALMLFAVGCGGRHPADGSGTIECTQVDLSSLVAGRIAEMSLQEGDVVRVGDTVARLDSRDYELRRDEAAAAVAVAQAQLDLLKAGSRPEDIRRAEEMVREAEALAEGAKADLRRVTSLFEAGSVTEKQMDDARMQADRTAAGLAAAKQVLARAAKGSREEELRLAEAQRDQARARLAVAEKAVADCVVKAPVAGIVTTKNREAGEVTAVGGPLLTLSRLDEVWLSVYVAEGRLAGVRIGQPAWIRVDGDPRLHEGRVTYVSSVAEFTPRNVQTPDERAKLVYRVKITVKNPQGLFKPGMPAEGFLKRFE